MKEDVINEILYMNRTMNLPLESILHTVLDKYNITAKKSEVMVIDNGWERELDEYLKRLVLRGLSPGTIKQYRFKLKNAFEMFNKPTKEISTVDIATYIAYLKNVRGSSQRYIENTRVVLNGYFGWCLKHEIIESNPVDGIERMKVPLTKIKPFTEEEVERFRKACDETRYSVKNRAMVELFYSSGLRCSELRNIDICDINFQKREGIIYNGKGAKDREFFFSDIASYYLQEYLNTRTDHEDALFISKSGKRYLSNSGIENVISTLGEIGHVKGAKPHRLRHTFIQRCIDRGMNVQDVMNLVGHTNIQTTMEYYEMNQRHTKEVYGRMFN